MPLGARVELTGRDMYLFLDKMTQCVLPRISDWPGINPEGNNKGVISFDLPSASVGCFPDIEPHFDMFPRLFDTTVTMHTSGKSDWESTLCLSGFQLPFLEAKIIKEVDATDKVDDPWALLKEAKTRTERKALAALMTTTKKK